MFGLLVHLSLFFVCASRDGSGQTIHMHSLAPKPCLLTHEISIEITCTSFFSFQEEFNRLYTGFIGFARRPDFSNRKKTRYDILNPTPKETDSGL